MSEATDEAVETKEIEIEHIAEPEVVKKKQKRTMTPEYKAILVERLAKARAVKRAAHDAGVTPARKIHPDIDEPKRFYCETCRKSYKSHESLKRHNHRFHQEKKLSNIIQEKMNEKENVKQDKVEPVGEPEKEIKEIKKEIKEVKELKEQHIVSSLQAPPPPPPPVLERRQVNTGPARYTYDEYKQIEKIHITKQKQKDKEAKAQAKQAHILKSIELMKAGGVIF